MGVIVYYLAAIVKIRKFKRLKVKILTYTCFYYKIVVNLRIYTDITN